MPPKKKSITQPRNQSTLNFSLSSNRTNQILIPKKPLFLTVKFTSSNQAFQVRTKLWKIRSCKVDLATIRYENHKAPTNSIGESAFSKFLTSPTLGKIFKTMNKLDFSTFKENEYESRRLFKHFRNLKKLNFVFLTLNAALLKTMLTKSLSPHIQNLSLKNRNYLSQKDAGQCYFGRLCKYLERFRKNESEIELSAFSNVMKVKLGKITHMRNASSLKAVHFIHPIMSHFDQVLREMYICILNNSHLDIIFAAFPSFPNLKKLKLHLSVPPEQIKAYDFSFLAKSPKVESLSLILSHISVDSLEFLTQLSHLNELSIQATGSSKGKPSFQGLPISLKGLQRVTLYFELIKPNLENLREFLKSSLDLKSLSLTAHAEHILEIFSEEDLVFPVRELTLCMSVPGRNNLQAYDSFANIFSRHPFVKKLTLNPYICSAASFNPIIKSLKEFRSLESLRINFQTAGKREDGKFERLKDLFAKLPTLKSVDLNLQCDLINSKELGNLVDGFLMLKNLESFCFKAKFAKITPSTYKKFISFLQCIKHINFLDIDIQGLSGDQTNEISFVTYRNLPFWKSTP